MTRTRALASGLLSLSAAAVLALTAAAGAVAKTSPEDRGHGSSTVVGGLLDSVGAAEYWTEDRMRAAIPADVLAAKAPEGGNSSSLEPVRRGGETKVSPTKGQNRLGTKEEPVATIGKVFFTLNGGNFVCSGNAVTSDNESTVATAAHCLSDGGPARPSKFIFVPAYENGRAPYGEWEAKSYFVPALWKGSAVGMTYDTGFVVVGPDSSGASLTDVVGGSGAVFNQDRGLSYTAFGYPASKPFNGEQLRSCTGTAADDPHHPEFETQGIPCDLNGGSSGGPWFIKGSDSTTAGYQNSVNSYGYAGSPVMYGPYWGDVIKATYLAASASKKGLVPAL